MTEICMRVRVRVRVRVRIRVRAWMTGICIRVGSLSGAYGLNSPPALAPTPQR